MGFQKYQQKSTGDFSDALLDRQETKKPMWQPHLDSNSHLPNKKSAKNIKLTPWTHRVAARPLGGRQRSGQIPQSRRPLLRARMAFVQS